MLTPCRKSVPLRMAFTLSISVLICISPSGTDNVWSGTANWTENVLDGMLGFSPTLSLPSIARIQFTPFGRLGYRKVGWSARVPFPYVIDFGASPDLVREFYRIRLPVVDLWLAEGGVEALLAGDATLGFRISGNILQNILNSWFPETGTEAERLLWRSRNFSWIELDLYAIKPIKGSFCMKSGIRYDDFRLAFKDPYEINNISATDNASVGFRAYQAGSHVWAPYLGLGWNGDRLKAFITASAFAPSTITMQSRVSVNIPKTSSFSCYTTFSSNEPASYLELSLEYAVDLPYGMNFRVWGRSGWLQAAGKGQISSDCLSNARVSTPGDDASHLTFTRVDGAAGLSINLTF